MKTQVENILTSPEGSVRVDRIIHPLRKDGKNWRLYSTYNQHRYSYYPTKEKLLERITYEIRDMEAARSRFRNMRFKNTSLEQLKDKLLTFGGERFQADWFLKENLPPFVIGALIFHGKLFEPKSVKFIEMKPSHCHENCEVLHRKKGWEWFSGMALSKDNIWRVHSWLFNNNHQLVETTEPRVKYYGLLNGHSRD